MLYTSFLAWCQAAFFALAVSLPGHWLFRKSLGYPPSNLEDRLWAGLLGALSLFFVLWISALFYPTIFSPLSWALFLLTGSIWIVQRARCGRWVEGTLALEPVGTIALLGAILAILLCCPALGAYPGIVTASFGDIPSYYRVSQNLAAGRGLLNDVVVTDFGGRYFIPTTHPLLAVLGGFLFAIFGVNRISLDVITIAASVACLFLFARMLERMVGEKERTHLQPLLCAVPLLVPGACFLLGISHPSFLSALGAFLAANELLSEARRMRHIAAALAFSCLAGSTGVFLTLPFLAWLLMDLTPQQKRKKTLAITIPSVVLLGGFILRELFRRKMGTLSYFGFSEERGFYFLAEAWWEMNFAISRHTMALPSLLDQQSSEIGLAIAKHPLAFLRSALAFSWSYTAYLGVHREIFFSCSLAGLLAAWRMPAIRLPLFVGAAYLPLHAIASAAVSPRHYYPALLFLFACALAWPLRWVLSRKIQLSPLALQALAWMATAAMLFMEIPDLAKERARPQNSIYLHKAQNLAEQIPPYGLVASEYPALLAFLLDRPTVGASNLGLDPELTKAILEKYQPSAWMMIDPMVIGPRPDTEPQPYERFREKNVFSKGYSVVFDDPAFRTLILRKSGS